MNLVRLLTRLGPGPLRRLIIVAVAAAISNTVLLAIVNSAAQEIEKTKADFVDLPLAALFVVCLLLYVKAQSWMVAGVAVDLERVLHDLRMRLLDRIRHADLRKLERFGATPLFDTITVSCQTISQNSYYLATTPGSILTTLAILVYILIISPLAFLLISLLLGIGTISYLRLGRALEVEEKRLAGKEASLFESVSDLFDGFKEQRLNSARSRGLNDIFNEVSKEAVKARNTVHMHRWQQFVFGETAFNLMLGMAIFVVPSYSAILSQEVAKIAAAVLFMASPVFWLMQALAVMSGAEAAAGRMLELEGKLGDLTEAGSNAPTLPVPEDFSELRMDAVAFGFPAPPGEPPFTVGPFSLVIRRGEVIFVTGGNGSGKSTFIRLLTGLYHPQSGRLLVDGTVIGAERKAAYRELMATVFADFHLFVRLYGIGSPDAVEAGALMRWMEMDHVTMLQGDRFGRRDLSAGQRKRLGLVAALLERKPILILDEWAADQDPHFRFKFYREIIPELKRRGLTIIAVTHDDAYFDAADRRLHMEEGHLTELPVPPKGAA